MCQIQSLYLQPFTRYAESPKILKESHLTPFEFFFVRTPQWPICVPNLKFLASAVPEIWRGSQNFKSRSRYIITTLFDLILYFFLMTFGGQSACQIQSF